MREMTLKNPAKSSATAAVCVLSSVLIGWMSMYLSGALKNPVRPRFSPNSIMLPVLWTAVFAVLGFCLYLTINTLAVTRSKISARNYSLTLWLLIFSLAVLWLFFFYGLKTYIVAFVFAAFAAAAISALIVMSLKINKLTSLLMLSAFAWIFYCGWLSLSAAV